MARPKRVFTDFEEAMIANYALDGGKNNTIAMAMDMPVNTLTNRFSKLLKEYRAYRKLKLARNQTRQSETSPQMAIFLGKNELDQKDKQEITDGHDIKSQDITPEQQKLYAEVAKEVMARQRQESIKIMEAG